MLGYVFSSYLFNLYSEAVLKVLSGFIIGGHNLNDIRYADDIVLIADTEKKLQDLLEKVAKESEKEGLSLNYKKTECIVIRKKISSICNFIQSVQRGSSESPIRIHHRRPQS